MSQENVEFVRKPLRVRDRSRRTVDQRLALRFPRAFRRVRRWGGRLPPASRIRRAGVAQGVSLGYEAFNRRDLEATLINYHRDLDFFPARPMIESGMVEASYRGHDGYRRFFDEWLSVWGSYRGSMQELIDLGDRLLTLGYLEGHAESSGVRVTQEYASLMTLKDGQVIRQQEYFDHAEALEAVGLSE
jgi:ketosteroid isomerase-like protein